MSASTHVRVRARQWNVGHGGFHTQEISLPADQATNPKIFVYDCGSADGARNLTRAIKLFVRDLRARRITDVEQIVISHFDEDHASKLRELADLLHETARRPRIQVKRVVAPYLSALAALRLSLVGEAPRARWYRSLLREPENVLEDLFPGAEVVLASDESASLDDAQRWADSTDSPAGTRIDRDRNGGVRVVAIAADGTDETVLWEVLPLVTPEVRASQDDFTRHLADASITLADMQDLIETVGRRQGRRALRAILGNIPAIRDVNASSLILYSGSPGHASIEAAALIEQGGSRWVRQAGQAGVGWLGTGDAYLRSPSEVDWLVSSLGWCRVHSITLVAAPHHGSGHNSGLQFWRSFPNAIAATLHASGAYGLPDSGVLRAIEAARLARLRTSRSDETVDIQFVVDALH